MCSSDLYPKPEPPPSHESLPRRPPRSHDAATFSWITASASLLFRGARGPASWAPAPTAPARAPPRPRASPIPRRDPARAGVPLLVPSDSFPGRRLRPQAEPPRIRPPAAAGFIPTPPFVLLVRELETGETRPIGGLRLRETRWSVAAGLSPAAAGGPEAGPSPLPV